MTADSFEYSARSQEMHDLGPISLDVNVLLYSFAKGNARHTDDRCLPHPLSLKAIDRNDLDSIGRPRLVDIRRYSSVGVKRQTICLHRHLVAPLSGVSLGLQKRQVLLPFAHGRIARAVASLALGNDAVGRELPVVSRRGNSIFFDSVGLKHVDQLTRGKALAL